MRLSRPRPTRTSRIQTRLPRRRLPRPLFEAAAPANAAWERALAAWLAAHRVYPEAARRRGIEGHVTLRFSVNQSGHVAAVTVLRGSGSPILDSAAEAMVRGAAVPAPPRFVRGQVTVSVQVDYVLAN